MKIILVIGVVFDLSLFFVIMIVILIYLLVSIM